MPANSKSKVGSRKWWQRLDEQEVQEAMDEATVDANGEDEQHTGLLTVIQDELEFPFSAELFGEVVQVTDMQWPEDDHYGLDLVCERNGRQQAIEARNVELVEPLPEGHLYLAAYLDWKRRLC